MSAENSRIDAAQKRRAAARFAAAAAAANAPAALAAERLWERVQDMAQTPARAADIGGNGVFVAAKFPRARVFAAARAPRLLRGACAGVAAAPAALPFADAAFDLLWSVGGLQAEDAQTAAEFARVCKPGGLLALAAPGPSALQEMRQVFADENRVHHFADMHNIADLLLANGFAEPLAQSDRVVFTYANAQDALADLRNVGCGNALAARPRGLVGRRRWRRACDEYTARFAVANGGGRVYATLELLLFTAWRRDGAQAEGGVHPLRFLRRN